MKFKDYWTSLSATEKRALAKGANRSQRYLGHVAAERKEAGEKLAVFIHRFSGGLVTVYELRQDSEEVWPRDLFRLLEATVDPLTEVSINTCD